ncbi:MAG: dihydroorotase, partial [Polaromonas sp.]
MKLLIKNGRVIDPATGFDQVGDVAIAAGRILSLNGAAADFMPNKTIDAHGCIVMPGLIDLSA